MSDKMRNEWQNRVHYKDKVYTLFYDKYTFIFTLYFTIKRENRRTHYLFVGSIMKLFVVDIIQ